MHRTQNISPPGCPENTLYNRTQCAYKTFTVFIGPSGGWPRLESQVNRWTCQPIKWSFLTSNMWQKKKLNNTRENQAKTLAKRALQNKHQGTHTRTHSGTTSLIVMGQGHMAPQAQPPSGHSVVVVGDHQQQMAHQSQSSFWKQNRNHRIIRGFRNEVFLKPSYSVIGRVERQSLIWATMIGPFIHINPRKKTNLHVYTTDQYAIEWDVLLRYYK